MKIKQLFKKAFTVVELVIVIAAVAILAATSVGIYFGVTNSNSVKESLSIQERVLDLWNDYINNGIDYLSSLESKAHEFCTGYVEDKGIQVKLNYRVLEFEDNINSYIDQYKKTNEKAQVERAYDQSTNSNEIAFIKIESPFPTYFISTSYTVVEASGTFETEDAIVKSIYDHFFVKESLIVDAYFKKEFSTANFSKFFFDLSDINVEGEIKRGIRYIRYDVYNNNDEDTPIYYTTVFGRANRTLNDEAGGRYTPIAIGGNDYASSKFVLTEEIDEVLYRYDPNHLYEYEQNIYDSNLEKITEVNSSSGTTVKCPLLTSNSEFVVAQKAINYKLTFNDKYGVETDELPPSGVVGDNNVVPPIDVPYVPEIDDTIPEDGPRPITLMFGSEVTPNGNSVIINWLKELFGIYDDSFRFVYFFNFAHLYKFITSEEFKGLVPVSESDKDTRKIVFVDGEEVVLDIDMVWPEEFTLVVDHVAHDTKEAKENEHEKWYKGYKHNQELKEKGPNRTFLYPNATSNRYTSTFGNATNSLIIPDGRAMVFKKGSLMLIEGDVHALTSTSGFQVGNYGYVQNNGHIVFQDTTGLRCDGIIDGSGRIIAQDGSTVTEPFKVTDWLGLDVTNSEFVNKETFFSDFYFLDSIRCELEINQGANYRGYIPFYYYFKESAVNSYNTNVFTDFNIVSDIDEDSLFSVHENSKIIKSCDENGKTTLLFERGRIEYNSLGFDGDYEIYFLLGALIANTRPKVKAFDDFNNGRTGFKLSNIDIVVGKDESTPATFIMSDYEKIDGEWRAGKLEVLPGSSIHINKNSSLELDRQNALILNDFYANQSMSDVITNYSTNALVKERFDILRNKFNSTGNMLINEGNITINDTLTSSNRTETEFTYTTYVCPHTKSQCHEQHGTGGYYNNIFDWKVESVTRSCEEEIVGTRDYTYTYFTAAIFSWSKSKIQGLDDSFMFKDTFNSNLITRTETVYEEHTHKQTNCPQRKVSFPVSLTTTYTYNTFLYKNIAYPIFEIRNSQVSFA